MKALLTSILRLRLAPWVYAAEPVCIVCHSSDLMKPEYKKVYADWKASWHAQNNVSCFDCHGGDPNNGADAMNPKRGFLGVPKPTQVPEFCGKCHVGILRDYQESGHGKALQAKGNLGPNCVTCHTAHGVQKANIDIINETLCSKCHSYDRAKIMKQALFGTEEKIHTIDGEMKTLKAQGLDVSDEEKAFFRTQVDYRALFHTVDVSLVKRQTDSFNTTLDGLQKKLAVFFQELEFRRNFAGFLMLLFLALAVVAFLLVRSYRANS